MTDIKGLKDEELKQVSGGNDNNGDNPKYQKGQSVYFTFFGIIDGGMGSNCDVVAFGPIEDVYKKSGGYYYDIHHGYLTIINGGNFLIPSYIREKTEYGIPEKNVNLTGKF